MWEAFEILSSRRAYNEAGPQPLPFAEISSFAEYAQVRDSEWKMDLLFRTMFRLDSVYLDHHSRKMAKENKRKGRRGAPRSKP